MSFGTPDSLDQMGDFLRQVFKGRPVSEQTIRAFQERYKTFGGRSPLLDISKRIAAALEKELGVPVRVGMRNWHPFIADAVQGLGDRIIGVCLAAQYSPHSVSKNFEALRAAASNVVDIPSWHRQPKFLEAWNEVVSEGLQTHRPDVVLFTAHSIPEEGAEPYPTQLRETMDAITTPGVRREFAYQSASPTGATWLGPDVDEKLKELRGRRVMAAPIGFTCDHAEILYDLDHLHRKTAERLGIAWSRCRSLNDHPKLIQALAAAVREKL
jgi:ferrochelatase